MIFILRMKPSSFCHWIRFNEVDVGGKAFMLSYMMWMVSIVKSDNFELELKRKGMRQTMYLTLSKKKKIYPITLTIIPSLTARRKSTVNLNSYRHLHIFWRPFPQWWICKIHQTNINLDLKQICLYFICFIIGRDLPEWFTRCQTFIKMRRYPIGFLQKL